LHAIEGRLAEPSQYVPQYLLPFAAGQLHPGCAHFSIFFSAMETPVAFSPTSIRLTALKINPARPAGSQHRAGNRSEMPGTREWEATKAGAATDGRR
jgi:hypothetical protein